MMDVALVDTIATLCHAAITGTRVTSRRIAPCRLRSPRPAPVSLPQQSKSSSDA